MDWTLIIIVAFVLWAGFGSIPLLHWKATKKTNELLQEQNLYLRLLVQKEIPGVTFPGKK